VQLNNTSQYAIRILSYMANQEKSELINATKLAEILQIPYKFLTKIMTELVKANLVESIRGRDGGYILTKEAFDTKLDTILELFNDAIKDEQCILGIGFCDGVNKCALHDQWVEPKNLIQRMFKDSTLKDIAGIGCKR